MDNLYLPTVNWLTIGTDGTDGQCFGGATLASLTFANYLIHQRILQIYRCELISPSVPMDNLYLPTVNWLTIGTDGTDGQCFGGATLASLTFANYLIHQRILQIYRCEFISPSVPMDNLYLPTVNWLTIGTDGTDGQCFGGATLASLTFANYLIHQRILQIYRCEFISPSVPMDNLYLPMVNWLTIGNGEHSLLNLNLLIKYRLCNHKG